MFFDLDLGRVRLTKSYLDSLGDELTTSMQKIVADDSNASDFANRVLLSCGLLSARTDAIVTLRNLHYALSTKVLVQVDCIKELGMGYNASVALRAQRVRETNELDSEIREIESKKGNLETRKKGLLKEVEELKEENDRIVGQINIGKELKKQQSSLVEMLEKENKDLKAKTAELQADAGVAHKNYNTLLTAALATDNAEGEKLKEKKTGAMADLAGLQKELDVIEKEVQAARDLNQTKRDLVEETRKIGLATDKEVATVRRENAAKVVLLAQARRDLEAKTAVIANFEKTTKKVELVLGVQADFAGQGNVTPRDLMRQHHVSVIADFKAAHPEYKNILRGIESDRLICLALDHICRTTRSNVALYSDLVQTDDDSLARARTTYAAAENNEARRLAQQAAKNAAVAGKAAVTSQPVKSSVVIKSVEDYRLLRKAQPTVDFLSSKTVVDSICEEVLHSASTLGTSAGRAVAPPSSLSTSGGFMGSLNSRGSDFFSGLAAKTGAGGTPSTSLLGAPPVSTPSSMIPSTSRGFKRPTPDRDAGTSSGKRRFGDVIRTSTPAHSSSPNTQRENHFDCFDTTNSPSLTLSGEMRFCCDSRPKYRSGPQHGVLQGQNTIIYHRQRQSGDTDPFLTIKPMPGYIQARRSESNCLEPGSYAPVTVPLRERRHILLLDFGYQTGLAMASAERSRFLQLEVGGPNWIPMVCPMSIQGYTRGFEDLEARYNIQIWQICIRREYTFFYFSIYFVF